MNYIILDMEWNQGYPGAKVFIGDTRRQLSGEIIQIGAVKLNECFEVTDTYRRLVRPVFYRKMHYKVQELTGITKEQLLGAKSFTEVLPDFIAWCGEEHEFLIWGADDISILRQNIEINKQGGYKIHDWYNLQLIYNAQYKSEHKQVALSTACEALGINTELQLHDALNDALYTAEICKKLDMKTGLATCRSEQKNSEDSCKRKFRYYDFGNAKEALEFTSLTDNFCPLCGGELIAKSDYHRKYYNQFSAVRECEKHGFFVENIIVSKINENAVNSKYKSAKTIQRAKDSESAFENIKAQKRRRRKHKKNGGEKQTVNNKIPEA